MRTFEQFIGRRKIQNVNNWLKGMNITTEEQLKAWCDAEEVYYPKQNYFGTTESAPAVASQVTPSVEPEQATTKAQAPKADKEWVPAAERSRKTRGRKPKVAKPTVTTEPEDESNTKNAKKPATKQRKR